MTTLGQAYVEVHADTRPFARELKRQITDIIKKTDASVSTEGVKVGEHLGASIRKGMDKETDKAVVSWRHRIVTGFRKIGHDGADNFEKAFQRLANGNFILFRVIGAAGVRITQLGRSIGTVAKSTYELGRAFLKADAAMLSLGFEGLKSILGFSSDIAKGFQGVESAGASLLSSLVSLGTTVATTAVNFAAMGAVLAVLVSVMGLLVGTIIVALAPFADLLGFVTLLPAAFSATVAVVLPLIIALHDLGDAMKLVFERDPKKLETGLKKLSPVLQDFVMAMRTVAPILRSIQNTVQKNFFGPIMMALIPAIRAIAPALQRGLGLAAKAMGVFIANALTLFNDPSFQQFINELFPSVARMVESLSFPLIHLMQALADATRAALPTVERLIDKLGVWIDDFATSIQESIADGSFQEFLDNALDSLQSIWDLTQSLIGLFTALFSQTDDGGRRFLDKLTKAINDFTAWVKSPEGKKAIEDMVTAAIAFATALGIALKIAQKIWTVMSGALHLITATLAALGILQSATNSAVGGGLSGAGHGMQTTPQYSGGGVVPYDQIAMVHKGEPILDPANSDSRNRSILADAGMLGVLNQPQQITLYLDGQRLYENVDYRIARNNTANARAMTAKPRG